jgi:hypothetical protein
MRIFALETNTEKLNKSFLSAGEQIIAGIRFSPFLFILRSLGAFVLTAAFIATGVVLAQFQLPAGIDVISLSLVWFFAVFLRWLTAFIDWRFDVLLITSEEVVIVDQSSLFRVKIRQMNLDNIASVAAESQFGNILPFGRIHLELKEGTGQEVVLPYIPQAAKVASIISDTIVLYQRRKAVGVHLAVQQQEAARVVEQK